MIDRRVIAADPDAARKRTEAARADRCVVRQVGEDGMGVIKAILPAEGAVSVYELLDAIARATAGQDDRPMGARRADALIDICVSLLTDGHVDVTPMKSAPRSEAESEPNAANGDEQCDESRADKSTSGGVAPDERGADEHGATTTSAEAADTDKAVTIPSPGDHVPASTLRLEDEVAHHIADIRPIPSFSAAAAIAHCPSGTSLTRVMTHHGRSTHLNVTMSATTLAAFADHPATLAGHGAITADVARMIADSIASLTVIAVNEQGHAMAVGGTTYPPRQAARDQVIAANPTCRFPACRQPAHLCELDHRDPFDHANPTVGGRTDPTNLDPLCKNNHLLKTHTDWSAVRAADGVTLAWTSPTGHCYLDLPFEHALPEQDLRTHVQRFRNHDYTSGGPFMGRGHRPIGLADPEHVALCADPTSTTETSWPTAEMITRQFIRRQAVRESQDIVRHRIESMVRMYRSRHGRFGSARSRPAPRLFGRLVIEPVGTVEIRLQRLIAAVGIATPDAAATPDTMASRPPF